MHAAGLDTAEWLPSALKLFELKAIPLAHLDFFFDGRDLTDVHLDALCEAIVRHLDPLKILREHITPPLVERQSFAGLR
jgi:hypothetical protein